MTQTADEALVDQMAEFYASPLDFVKFAYPWGEEGGPLANQKGPFPWQVKFLTELGAAIRERGFNGVDPVRAIRMARSSGHGIGKSTLVAWLVDWAMSTRKNCRISVTANTVTQLETKTWAAIQYWTKMCITAHWFEVTLRKIRHKHFPESWLAVALTCDKDNSEAFAGQHSAGSSSIYIFDEASAVPDEIWDVADGGLVKGEPMFFAFGNPTRNSGRFFRVNFGSEMRRWNHGAIDARDAGGSVSEEIAGWLEDYGEDSDFFRVRVRGLPPRASDVQFITNALVQDARKRDHKPLDDEPLVAGYDAANGGMAFHTIVFRRGLDAKNVPPMIKLPGDTPRDKIVGVLANIMADRTPERKVTALFGDQAFGSVILARLVSSGFTNCFEVNFGGEAPDKRHFANMRSWMWFNLREWLYLGAVPDVEDLELDLCGPGSETRANGQLVLESKSDMAKRGVKSPDWADALCFEANTMILTPTGERPIQDLGCGDFVETPFGPVPIEAVWISEASELTTAHFSNGSTLRGKPSHDIFTFGRGRVALDALTLYDEVSTSSSAEKWAWRLTNLWSTQAINGGFKHQVDTFSQAGRLSRSAFFIDACTSIITGPYRTVMRFTTAIMIGETMNHRTLSPYPQMSMGDNTWPSDSVTPRNWPRIANTWNWLAKRLRSGIGRRRVESGIVNMAERHGSTVKPPRLCVNGVETPSKPTLSHAQSIAAAPVSNPFSSGPISQILVNVLSVAKTLLRTATGRPRVVPVSVQTASVPPTFTYNLTLRDHNAYYANGILVFNCLTFARKVAPQVQVQKPRWQPPPSGRTWMSG